MDDLLEFAIEQGGIVALLVIVVMVLWIHLTKHTVSKEAYLQLLKRLEALDRDIVEGVIPSIRGLYESEKNTQQTLSELRRNQELQGWLMHRLLPPGPQRTTGRKREILDLLSKLADDDLDRLAREISKRRAR